MRGRAIRSWRRSSRRALALCLIGVTPFLTGCSVLFMNRPGWPAEPDSPPECTRSAVAPVLDVGLAVASGALAYAALNACNNCESAAPAYLFAAALVVVPVGIISGTTGFQRRSDCEHAWSIWCEAHPAWAGWEGCKEMSGPAGARVVTARPTGR